MTTKRLDKMLSMHEIDQAVTSLMAELNLPSSVLPADLPAIAANDFPDSESAFEIVSRISGLIIRRQHGESDLRTAEGLSTLVYGLERVMSLSHARSTLYRGLCQIGLGQYEIGAKNVSSALRSQEDSDLSVDDLCLGYWGLVTAAVRFREIGLALGLTRQYRDLTEQQGLENESERAGQMALLLSFVNGDSVRDESSYRLDIPLFLGLNLGAAEPVDFVEQPDDDFGRLLQLRRSYNDVAALAEVEIEQLAKLALLLAHWDLAIPLREAEMLLRERDPHHYYELMLGRAVGGLARDRIMADSMSGPAPEALQSAIIWMVDVVGYSTLSGEVEAQELFAFLSPMYKIINDEFSRVGGTILEFVGDSILVVFNVFESGVTPEQEVIRGTARFLSRMRSYMTLAENYNNRTLGIGVGISQGDAALGYLGGLSRCHLATLGGTVNIAARLEAKTRNLPSPIVLEVSLLNGDDGLPSVWQQPEETNFSVRYLGPQQLKNVAGDVYVYGVSPLIRSWVDFVPMGHVATPQKGVCYIDVGDHFGPGVIDHHGGVDSCQSACAVIISHPEFILDHFADDDPVHIEFRMHREPDFDGVAALYCAYELMDEQRCGETFPLRSRLREELADYVSVIDQGLFPNFSQFSNSLYGIFSAHQHRLYRQGKKINKPVSDRTLLEAGLRVVDAAMFLAEKQQLAGEAVDFSSIFSSVEGWFGEERTLLLNDERIYRNEDLKGDAAFTYQARVGGRSEKVTGLWLTNPKSALFKIWARNDAAALSEEQVENRVGYQFLTVHFINGGSNRFVISVDPDSGYHLKGLGEALDDAESQAYLRQNKIRSTEPKRYPTKFEDPWYYGWGHQFTIVDSPASGTLLSAEQVKKIHMEWMPR